MDSEHYPQMIRYYVVYTVELPGLSHTYHTSYVATPIVDSLQCMGLW